MAINNNLKAWVRYDGNKNIVAGSLILQKNKPKVGTWKEFTDVNLCCSTNSNICEGNFNWFFIDDYAPAFLLGSLTSPNHTLALPNTDFNLIGTGGYELYINQSDSNNNFTSYLSLLVEHSGYLTLSQGNNSITFGFTDEAFTFEFDNIVYDDVFGPSPFGSLVLISPANNNFNANSCISILIDISEPFITTTTTTTTLI